MLNSCCHKYGTPLFWPCIAISISDILSKLRKIYVEIMDTLHFVGHILSNLGLNKLTKYNLSNTNALQKWFITIFSDENFSNSYITETIFEQIIIIIFFYFFDAIKKLSVIIVFFFSLWEHRVSNQTGSWLAWIWLADQVSCFCFPLPMCFGADVL